MAAAVVAFAVVLALGTSIDSAEAAEDVLWRDASELTIEGKGWSDTPSFFSRLPARAKESVPEGVWGLSLNTAGIVVRFVSDAPWIRARWRLTGATLAMNHMAATGVSGLDLYLRHKGSWRWLGVGRPEAQENLFPLVSGLSAENREFALYLPLYNGVTKLELGIPPGSSIKPATSRAAVKPVVFYGTSITHGGCASRPGMAYPAIIGRRLDTPTINLGFSGNGRCEHEVADLIAELDASVYVIDPLPNMTEDMIEDRIGYLLEVLRSKHPHTPVILVESIDYQYSYAGAGGAGREAKSNRKLRKVYSQSAPAWNGRLFYVKGDQLLGSDGEGTVDGVHPTDLGFMRMADVLTPVVERAISQAHGRK